MREDCIFFCPIRVRYNEVDQQGIVYNGNYIIYTDVAFDAFFRSRGYPFKDLVYKYDSEVCHKKSSIEYNSSAFDEDELEVGVRVLRIGTKSFTLGFEIYRKDEDDILVLAEVTYVGYDSKNRVSRPITDLMKSILAT